MQTIGLAVGILGGIALLSAIILYFVSRKFQVTEDERIASVSEALPQANCGGCGFAGCSNFASACVKEVDKSKSLGNLACPVGGKPVMEKVSAMLGVSSPNLVPHVAVVRCSGNCENRPRTASYEGTMTCRTAALTGVSDTLCAYGCLGCGDCVAACNFGAIAINEETKLPEVNFDLCTGCGACAKACPRNIIELRPLPENQQFIYVSCVNHDKGPIAQKVCKVSCIACSRCIKVCESAAITLENNVTHIDPEKCTLCGKCVSACSKHSIIWSKETAS